MTKAIERPKQRGAQSRPDQHPGPGRPDPGRPEPGRAPGRTSGRINRDRNEPARAAVRPPRQSSPPTRAGAPVGRPGQTPGLTRAARVQKRCLDLVVGGVALVLLSPVLLAVAAAVRLSSRGPAVFRQRRIGQHGQPFEMLKFRSMYVDNDDAIHRDFTVRELRGEDPRDDGGAFKPANDPRVTRLGRVLRVSSLDELPQLINVLRGEMSLVGPRPPLDWEVALYRPEHHERFRVKPGITGLWQVSGRNRLTMLQALDLDIAYVRRQGLLFDLTILARTVPALFRPGSAR